MNMFSHPTNQIPQSTFDLVQSIGLFANPLRQRSYLDYAHKVKWYLSILYGRVAHFDYQTFINHLLGRDVSSGKLFKLVLKLMHITTLYRILGAEVTEIEVSELGCLSTQFTYCNCVQPRRCYGLLSERLHSPILENSTAETPDLEAPEALASLELGADDDFPKEICFRVAGSTTPTLPVEEVERHMLRQERHRHFSQGLRSSHFALGNLHQRLGRPPWSGIMIPSTTEPSEELVSLARLDVNPLSPTPCSNSSFNRLLCGERSQIDP